MNSFFLLACLATLAVACAQTADYCDSKLCSPGYPHIACNHNGAWASICGSDRRLVDMKPLMKQILTYHNEKRNLVAGGNLRPYQPAARMASMVWDDELAKLAELNVKQCKMSHDKCRSTSKHIGAGQNLAYMSYSGEVDRIKDGDLVSSLLEMWFNEHPLANMNIINSYVSATDYRKAYGHFTVMVNDFNNRVGCAVSRTFMDTNNYFFMACNYAGNNWLGDKIYATSTVPASGCKKGKNIIYSNLCNPAEVY